MAAVWVVTTTATGSWRSKTASELREIGDKSLILSPILVFEHELNELNEFMVQISFYENGTGRFIKQWPNWSGEVPAVGDMVLLHFGDDNEEECENIVKLRVIDGTRPDYIKIFIEEIRRIKQPTDEEIEDLMREIRELNK